jgi:transposase
MTTVTVLPGPERRRRWTAAEKQRIVEESLSSGLSVAEFARQRDIHPNLLHSWRRPMKTSELPSPNGEARFVPVAVATAPSKAPAMRESDVDVGVMVEVVLRNGRVLRLSDGVVPGRLAQLADVLEGGQR